MAASNSYNYVMGVNIYNLQKAFAKCLNTPESHHIYATGM